MMLTLAFNALWQGAIVVALTAAALRLVSLHNAATRYAAWYLALLALVVVPIAAAAHVGGQLLAALGHRALSGDGLFSLVAYAAAPPAASRWLGPAEAMRSQVALAMGALWLGGALVALARLALSLSRIAGIRRNANVLGSADGIAVLCSTELTIPIATGVLSPAIVLPAQLVQALDEDELRCTIEHEIAHLRRGDVAANALQRLIEALLFWNPWVHFVGRRLVSEREAACDDWAVYRIGEADRYARALAALGRRISTAQSPLLTPSAFGSRNALVARIERLVVDRSPRDAFLNYVVLGVIVVLFAVATLVSQAFLPTPVHASTLPSVGTPTIVAGTTACKNPNAEPAALDPAAPDLPKAQWPAHKVTAIVRVTVAPTGKAASATIYRSSGDAAVDAAVLTAAKKSTYSPKMVNCIAVAGSYLFRADFAP